MQAIFKVPLAERAQTFESVNLDEDFGGRKSRGQGSATKKPSRPLRPQVLAHPRLVPYYRALCGEGYRLDHQPLLIAQDQDSEGFHLHGGRGAAGRDAGQRTHAVGSWRLLASLEPFIRILRRQ